MVPMTRVAQTINNAGTYIIVDILFCFGFQLIWRSFNQFCYGEY